MGALDKLLNAMRLNDDEDDYLDDDEFSDDGEEDLLDPAEDEDLKPRRFLPSFGKKREDDYLDDAEPVSRRESSSGKGLGRREVSSRKETERKPKSSFRSPAVSPGLGAGKASQSTSQSASQKQEKVQRPAASKITPMRPARHTGSAVGMEVCVIKPKSMEEAREIADTLIDNSTVVLSLEGIDPELAQRIIDFTSGACYSLGGTLQPVSSLVFVVGASNVDITGDIPGLLHDAAPSVKTGY